MTESEIRKALISHLSALPQGRGATFISELFIDGFARRADLVMANGKLAAFEIKSARDTLNRLSGQIQSYVRFFEQVTIVCAQRHVESVASSVPEQIGVWCVSDSGDLNVVRRAATKSSLRKDNWLSFLPVPELRALLRERGCKTVGDRPELVERAEKISLRAIRQYVLAYLKRRHKRIEGFISKRAAVRAPIAQGNRGPTYEQLVELLSAASTIGAAIPRARPRRARHSTSDSPSASLRCSEKSI